MKISREFEVQPKCVDCRWPSDEYFCGFERGLLKAFESIKITHSYAKGVMLFMEGQPASGVYMLCRGRVKLSTYSSDGKAMILRVAGAGEILGLSSTVALTEYDTTAEVLEACQVNFVSKKDFLAFLAANGEPAFNALRQLSNNYHAAHSQVRSLGLSVTVSDKLARLFLQWCEDAGRSGEVHIDMPYTHEQLASMIGSTRETVTRLLKTYRTRQLIRLNGSDLCIPDLKRLEDVIGAGISSADVI